MGHEEHRHEAPRSIRIFVVTASDTRGEAEDESGAFLRDAAGRAGHAIAGYRIVRDDPAELRAAWATFVDLCRPGRWAAFPLAGVLALSDRLEAEGHPSVHHSAGYRQAYCPAYRLAGSSYFCL